jgi:hypothetical protein
MYAFARAESALTPLLRPLHFTRRAPHSFASTIGIAQMVLAAAMIVLIPAPACVAQEYGIAASRKANIAKLQDANDEIREFLERRAALIRSDSKEGLAEMENREAVPSRPGDTRPRDFTPKIVVPNKKRP